MDKNKWISEKIGKLINEGFKRNQASAIAYSMYNKQQQAMQQGGNYYENNPSILNNYQTQQQPDYFSGLPQFDQNLNYQNQNQNAGYINQLSPSSLNSGQEFINRNPLPQGVFQENIGFTPEYQYQKPTDSTKNTTDNKRLNVLNPFGGVSLEGALTFAGQGFGEKDPFKATVGTGLSLLKGTRNFLSGYGAGKESKRAVETRQQGGKVSNAEYLTGQYITDMGGMGNVNIENGEYVKDNNTGELKKAVGDSHMKGGIDVQLNNANVLSNYTKIGAKNAKELKDKYNISVKKTDTFAKVLEKFDKSIGKVEETEEQAYYIKKLGKNQEIKDEATRTLNETYLNKEIQESEKKLQVLNETSKEMFDELFLKQEQIPKKGKQGEILDNKGKPVEVMQEGGTFSINYIATKYGISPERAQEIYMQQGGLINKEGLMNMTVSDTITSKPIGNLLPIKKVQSGVLNDKLGEGYFLYHKLPTEPGFDYKRDREFVTRDAFRDVVETSQEYQKYKTESGIRFQEGGQISEQEQILGDIAQMLQQGMQPNEIVQQLLSLGISEEQAMQLVQGVAEQMQPQEVMQEGGGYSFSTKYQPKVEGYNVDGTSIINQDNLSNVELMQPYTGKGYGAQMQDVEDTIKIHDWYFDTEEKKQEFRDAILKEGEQQPIKEFQKAYNEELKNRATKAGVPKKELDSIINEVGFSNKGVQKLDGKFGAFTSTRPLFNFSKGDTSDSSVNITVEDSIIPSFDRPNQNIESRNVVQNVLPQYPVDLRLPPSALQSVAKPYVPLQRIEPVKITPETMLAEQERLRQAELESVRASGLSPQIQQALTGQQLATSQLSANDAIAKAETFNAQNQFQADQFNIQQGDKEKLLNEQFNQTYQNQVMQGTANQERDWRRYFNEINLSNRQKFNDVRDTNLTNAMFEQFQSDGSNIYFMDNQAVKPQNTSIDPKQWENMTAQQQKQFVDQETRRLNQARMKSNYRANNN